MDIVLFKDITTEEALLKIESEGLKYEGLYVDMSKDDERRYVKNEADKIKSILKRLDRRRIDIAKEFKVNVEEEAASIKSRLEKSNEPYTKLIDQWAIKRAEQLKKEKELQAAKDLAFQLPLDHEEAISMNELFDFKKSEEIRKQKERDEEIAIKAAADAENRVKQVKYNADHTEALGIEAASRAEEKRLSDVEKAKQDEIDRQEKVKSDEAERVRKLEANKKHVGKVRGEIKEHLKSDLGFDDKTAKSVVLSLLKIKERVTINY